MTNFQKKIRYFIIIASLIIFCYQMKVAFENVLSNATADSTEYISISELDSPPVITFCPNQGIESASLDALGYWTIEDLMNGNNED